MSKEVNGLVSCVVFEFDLYRQVYARYSYAISDCPKNKSYLGTVFESKSLYSQWIAALTWVHLFSLFGKVKSMV
jgi:hypothetical protein